MVSSAFTLSTTNLKAVNNMQLRDEAIAAASGAIELVISSAFTSDPTGQEIDIDINNNGTTDYKVTVAEPQCVGFTVADEVEGTSTDLEHLSKSTWDTIWDIEATVNDTASGTRLKMRQGVLIRLGDTEKNNLCS
jgi:hypothetical protein